MLPIHACSQGSRFPPPLPTSAQMHCCAKTATPAPLALSCTLFGRDTTAPRMHACSHGLLVRKVLTLLYSYSRADGCLPVQLYRYRVVQYGCTGIGFLYYMIDLVVHVQLFVATI